MKRALTILGLYCVASIKVALGVRRFDHDGEATGCRSQGRGRVVPFLKSVLRLAPLAWMGLPAGVRPGSPSSFSPDRAMPTKDFAIRPSLCAFLETIALASPGGAPVPRGAS